MLTSMLTVIFDFILAESELAAARIIIMFIQDKTTKELIIFLFSLELLEPGITFLGMQLKVILARFLNLRKKLHFLVSNPMTPSRTRATEVSAWPPFKQQQQKINGT